MAWDKPRHGQNDTRSWKVNGPVVARGPTCRAAVTIIDALEGPFHFRGLPPSPATDGTGAGCDPSCILYIQSAS